MIQPHEPAVETIQTITLLLTATLSILLAALTFYEFPLPRYVHFSLAAVFTVNICLLFWTVRRLRQLRS